MKRKFMALVALPIFFALACSKNPQQPENASTDSQKMTEHLVNAFGFQAKDIVETADEFIVEGDTRFAKTNFWENYAVADAAEKTVAARSLDGEVDERKHYRYTYLVNDYSWPTIKVNIDYYVPQVWRDAILDAIAIWNGADGPFYFTPTYYNYSVNGSINVKMAGEAIGDLTVASCYYPSATAKPGSPLSINPNYNNLLYSKKVFAMVHEIGHALGIRHTDQNQGSLITNVSNSCKNFSDLGSVMRPFVAPWAGFSACDLEAYHALYGY